MDQKQITDEVNKAMSFAIGDVKRYITVIMKKALMVDDVIKFYKDEIIKYLDYDIDSMFGLAYINEGMPKLTTEQVVAYMIPYYDRLINEEHILIENAVYIDAFHFFENYLKVYYLYQCIDAYKQKIIMGEKKTFPKKLSIDDATRLRQFLLGQKLIDEDTKESDFIFLFGCGGKETTKRIKWIGTKQQARELLEGLYKKDLHIAEIEKLASVVFLDRKGKTMSLAKNKTMPSNISDNILNFLATL